MVAGLENEVLDEWRLEERFGCREEDSGPKTGQLIFVSASLALAAVGVAAAVSWRGSGEFVGQAVVVGLACTWSLSTVLPLQDGSQLFVASLGLQSEMQTVVS